MTIRPSAGPFIRLSVCAAVLLGLPLGACNDPLAVTDPDIVPPGSLEGAAALPTIRAGAIGDFTIAYVGSGADGSSGTVEGVIMYGGLLADEWVNSETFPTRIEVDARGPIRTDNADVGLWFRNMHRARRATETAAAALVTPALVPATFNYVVQHTENTTRENNGVFNGNVTFERYAVADREGGNGLQTRTASGGIFDPRTPWERTVSATSGPDKGFDKVTPPHGKLRYG